MRKAFEDAIQELKRVDHLFWVSLKYTRTVDVIKNTVQRLMNVFDNGLNSLLIYAKENKIIEDYSNIPGLKCDLLKKTFPENKKLLGYIDLYLRLRKILTSSYTKREEYRRHVTMITNINDEILDVNIDLLKEYCDIAKEFIHYVKAILDEEKKL